MPFDEIYSVSQIKTLLHKYGFAPSREYGQHYLISHGVIEAIVEAAGISPGDVVVEVGPGFGVLTLALSKAGAEVWAFEIERQLETYWQEQCLEYPSIHIVWGNAMQQFPSWLSSHNNRPYSIVANIPYQITGELLRMFLESMPSPRRIVVLVQKEVAERMCAKPGDMSLLSLATQYYGVPRIVRIVPAGAFFPPPKVASAVVCIDMYVAQEKHEDTAEFFRIAHAGFGRKRKQLASSLRDVCGVDITLVQQTLQSMGLSEKARPEELSVEQWKHLRDALAKVWG